MAIAGWLLIRLTGSPLSLILIPVVPLLALRWRDHVRERDKDPARLAAREERFRLQNERFRLKYEANQRFLKKWHAH